MELKQYIQVIRRWFWLLILGMLLGGAGGYAASRIQEPVYESSTRVLVMRAPQERSSDLTYLSDQQLVQTYIQLLNTQPVRDGTSDRLGYEISKEQIKVQQIRDTQVIEVVVEDHDPQHAADIGNVLVEVLIIQNEAMQSARYASTEESIQAQISQVENQINSIQLAVEDISTRNFQNQLKEVEAQIKPLEQEVAQLEQEIATLTPAYTQERKAQVAEKQARINQIKPFLTLYQQIYSNLVVLGKPVESGSGTNSRLVQLQSTLELYQNLYINLLSSLENIRLARLQNTPNVIQIEPAAIQDEPIRPRPIVNTVLAMLIGLMLAGGVVFLIEYMDDTFKTPDDVERTLGLPVLGFIAEMKYKRNSPEEVYITRQPRSPVSEAFRSLRTNLEFAAVEKPISTLLVTSPGPEEGKTTIAVNLAATFSQIKRRIVLLDADMRRPHVHQLMGMSNRDGLSSLFLNSDHQPSIGRTREDLPHLVVITSGNLPPNPAELLGSDKMSRILQEMTRNVDLVIIDTPPSLVVDALILAAKVDAVLFVIQPGLTKIATARATLESFKRSGARVVGVVMNRIPRNRSDYYGGYQYYSPYHESKGYYSDPGNGSKPSEKRSDPVTMPNKEAHVSGETLNRLFTKIKIQHPDPDRTDVEK